MASYRFLAPLNVNPYSARSVGSSCGPYSNSTMSPRFRPVVDRFGSDEWSASESGFWTIFNGEARAWLACDWVSLSQDRRQTADQVDDRREREVVFSRFEAEVKVDASRVDFGCVSSASNRDGTLTIHPPEKEVGDGDLFDAQTGEAVPVVAEAAQDVVGLDLGRRRQTPKQDSLWEQHLMQTLAEPRCVGQGQGKQRCREAPMERSRCKGRRKNVDEGLERSVDMTRWTMPGEVEREELGRRQGWVEVPEARRKGREVEKSRAWDLEDDLTGLRLA